MFSTYETLKTVLVGWCDVLVGCRDGSTFLFFLEDQNQAFLNSENVDLGLAKKYFTLKNKL